MKMFFLFLSTILLSASASISFYEIKFESLDGTIIKTSAYQGKKCVITVVSANVAGVNLVHYLDSIQKANTNVQVIAIPTNEFDGSVTVQELKDLRKNLSIVV